jgi:phosphoribosylglycinamide formyltransferase-1
MVDPFRVAFCVSGNGHLFRSAVLQHENLSIEPALLILDQKANEDIDDFAAKHGVRCERLGVSPRDQFDDQLQELLTQAEPDLISLTFDWLLPEKTVSRFSGRLINVHPALLPAFSGMNALKRTCASGSRFAGATIHEVDEGVDTGAIIAQCVLGLRRNENESEFGRRLFVLLRVMYLQVLAWYSSGRISHDDSGCVWVRDAVYGELPISPAIELALEDIAN